ncbi:DUF6134 family protein [Maribacter stanieri]|uniref:DUF6134 family protein n=1 Tax=Maribacter stanieri TaxID=440514 RepID=UPI00249506F5|nr:DUF6134 family protein [Maribacter stanieri]|tara:strand:- start:1772 stop:2389 length:618 start_codon:yes stop_codon:yes gene_type:complete
MSSFYQYIIVCSLLFFNSDYNQFNTIYASKNTLTFDIINKNEVIGNLKATKTSTDTKTHYQSVTTISTKILKEIKVNYKYDVTYERNKLKKANVYIDVNDKPYADILTNWEAKHYQITKNDKKEKVVEDEINYATILLYFNEPIDIERCYSEQDGSFNTIVPLGNHTYKKINAKNHENIYYYKNGFLQKAEINGGLVKFEIIAQK